VEKKRKLLPGTAEAREGGQTRWHACAARGELGNEKPRKTNQSRVNSDLTAATCLSTPLEKKRWQTDKRYKKEKKVHFLEGGVFENAASGQGKSGKNGEHKGPPSTGRLQTKLQRERKKKGGKKASPQPWVLTGKKKPADKTKEDRCWVDAEKHPKLPQKDRNRGTSNEGGKQSMRGRSVFGGH